MEARALIRRGAPLLVLLLLLVGALGMLVLSALSGDTEQSRPEMLDQGDALPAELDGRGDHLDGREAGDANERTPAHTWHLRVTVASTASVSLHGDHEQRLLQGVAVDVHLARPGVREFLARGMTNAAGVVALDVSALDLVPPVLRGLSQIHISAHLEGWYRAGRSMLDAHGHTVVLGLKAWPEDGQRSLAATVHLSKSPAVRGRAVDASGSPVESAGVRIRGQEHETLTRADGTFVLPIDKACKAHVDITDAETGQFSSELLDLDPGTNVDLGDVLLSRESVLQGRIVDGQGKPVSGLPLEVMRLSAWANRWQTGGLHYNEGQGLRGTTQAGGQFRIPAETWMTARDRDNVQPLDLLAYLGVRGLARPAFSWSLQAVADAHHKQQPLVLEHHFVRGRLELPGGTPLPGGQVSVRIWPNRAALADHPDSPEGTGTLLATGRDARFELFLGRGSVAQLVPHVRHATGEVVEINAPQEGPPQDLRIVVTPTTGQTGVALEVRGDVPVTQVKCRVHDRLGREVFYNEADTDHLRLPLAPGRYQLHLRSHDTRTLEGVEHRWGRYNPIRLDVVVPKEGFVSVIHTFELTAFVAVMPEIIGLPEVGALPKGKQHLRLWARLRLPGSEKDQVGWDLSWWKPGRSIGGPRSTVPGTYDLVVGGPAVETATVPLVVEAGEFLRPHVRLELKR